MRGLGKGWTVVAMRGQVQLKLRVPGSPASSVVLPFDWQKAVWGDAYIRIRNILVLPFDWQKAVWGDAYIRIRNI
ncbi:hypothetical protein C7K08_13120, partial [Synechococcus lacustris str. Tous]